MPVKPVLMLIWLVGKPYQQDKRYYTQGTSCKKNEDRFFHVILNRAPRITLPGGALFQGRINASTRLRSPSGQDLPDNSHRIREVSAERSRRSVRRGIPFAPLPVGY